MSRRGSRLTPLTTSLALVLAFGLGACGDDAETDSAGAGSGASADTGSGTPGDDSLEIALTRKGDVFTPNGERVEAAVGQPVVLTITADEPGELHVHSVPEQDIAYDAGTSEHEITIDRPGVVEVESHEPTVIVLQLEVR